MEANQQKAISTFSPKKVLLAISIGLSVTGYMLYSTLQEQGFDSMAEALSNPNWSWFLASLLVLFFRDAAYVFRIHHLTQKELNIKGSIYTILLWEFASAVTPSVVGGTVVAVFILAKEGIKLGKALAYVMLTAILDNAFFLIAAPFALLLTDENTFNALGNRELFGFNIRVDIIFYVSYGLIASYTLVMAYGLLINPRGFKWLLFKLTSIGFLRRWRLNAYEQSQEMYLASNQINGLGFRYWLKAIFSTILIWSARYFMLNCLITSFGQGIGLAEQFDIFAKQIILWIVQLISVTPGAAGLAEAFFKTFFEGSGYGHDALWTPLAVLWRIFTYYTYLVIGVIVFPRWLKKVS